MVFDGPRACLKPISCRDDIFSFVWRGAVAASNLLAQPVASKCFKTRPWDCIGYIGAFDNFSKFSLTVTCYFSWRGEIQVWRGQPFHWGLWRFWWRRKGVQEERQGGLCRLPVPQVGPWQRRQASGTVWTRRRHSWALQRPPVCQY